MKEMPNVLVSEAVGGEVRRWEAGYRRAAKRDRREWLEETRRTGLSLAKRLERIVEVVTMTVLLRATAAPDEPETLSWVKRFLGLQVYGAGPFACGGTYSVALMGPSMDVELFVDELRDVDLEDIYDSFGFVHMELHGREPIEEEEAPKLVRSIEDDLTYGGDTFDLSWELESGIICLQILRTGESGD